MTTNLKLSLVDDNGDPKTVTASRDDGGTFEFTPTSCGTAEKCPINGYTVMYADKYYYNYYAAIAGDEPQSINTDPGSSVCPAGWRLPSAINSAYSYGGLVSVAYGLSSSTAASRLSVLPLSFTAEGYTYNSSTPSYTNYYQYLESTSGQNANIVYALWAYGNNIYVDSSYYLFYRYQGRSVRCLAS